MLSKDRRLRKTSEFEAVSRSPRGLKRRGVLLKSAKNEKEVSRFGIVLGKKTEKRAVARNRARRLLREALKERLPDVREGHDVVLVVLSTEHLRSLGDAREIVAELLAGAGLLNAPE